MFKSFVKEVRVTDDKAVLNYSMPAMPDKVTIKRDGVLPSVYYGGR